MKAATTNQVRSFIISSCTIYVASIFSKLSEGAIRCPSFFHVVKVVTSVRAKIALDFLTHVLTGLVRCGLLAIGASILVFVLILTVVVWIVVIAAKSTASAVCII
jgi:hypothetical protein